MQASPRGFLKSVSWYHNTDFLYKGNIFPFYCCFWLFIFLIYQRLLEDFKENMYWCDGEKALACVFSTLPAAHPILCVVTSKFLLHTDQSTFEKKVKEIVKQQTWESAWKLSPCSYTHQTLSPQLTIAFARRL